MIVAYSVYQKLYRRYNHFGSTLMKYFLLLGWIVITISARAQSDPPPLGADRPGQGTDAASVMSRGAVQLEAGLFHEWNTEDGYSYWDAPTALLRYGITDRVEVRLTSGLYTDQERSGAGWSPLSVATKVALVEQGQGWVPQTALLVSLTLPSTGSEAVQPRFTEPDITLLLNHSVNSWLGITTNLGAGWGSDSPAATYRYAVSFDLTLSERLGAFAEFYGNLPEADASSHLFNAGFVYLLTPNVQLDLASGAGLTEEAPDFYVGGGIVVRWL